LEIVAGSRKSERFGVKMSIIFSRDITVEKNYIFFPIKNEAKRIKIWVCKDDGSTYDLDLRLDKNPDYLTWLDVRSAKGRSLTFSCSEKDILDLIYQADELPDSLYSEKKRPYYHFSPARGWVNDPNGLTYSNGVYHLFYQHNPYDVRWGNMHWGHSVSEDLFHWKDCGEALFPDENGTMFSGCAVYDKQNISGLGEGSSPLLLYYTCAGGDNAVSAGKDFNVCMAYSLDNGKTFIKYFKNPLVKNIVFGNRDPKIVWHEQSKKWIMVLFLQPFEFAFLSSSDLLEWKKESVCNFPSMNECPDFFPLGKDNKWVFLSGADYWGDGSVGKYVIGRFDGKVFTPESRQYPIDFGRDFYSLQTFDNEPHGRRILIGWQTRNFFTTEDNETPFCGVYSVPTELTPCRIDGELRLARYPVKEFFDLEGKIVYDTENNELNAVERDVIVFDDCVGRGYYVQIQFKPEENAMMVISMGNEEIIYDSQVSTLRCLGKNIKIQPDENGFMQILALKDVSGLEVFVQNGKYPFGGHIRDDSDKLRIVIYRGKITDFCCRIKKISDLFGKRK